MHNRVIICVGRFGPHFFVILCAGRPGPHHNRLSSVWALLSRTIIVYPLYGPSWPALSSVISRPAITHQFTLSFLGPKCSASCRKRFLTHRKSVCDAAFHSAITLSPLHARRVRIQLRRRLPRGQEERVHLRGLLEARHARAKGGLEAGVFPKRAYLTCPCSLKFH